MSSLPCDSKQQAAETGVVALQVTENTRLFLWRGLAGGHNCRPKTVWSRMNLGFNDIRIWKLLVSGGGRPRGGAVGGRCIGRENRSLPWHLWPRDIQKLTAKSIISAHKRTHLDLVAVAVPRHSMFSLLQQGGNGREHGVLGWAFHMLIATCRASSNLSCSQRGGARGARQRRLPSSGWRREAARTNKATACKCARARAVLPADGRSSSSSRGGDGAPGGARSRRSGPSRRRLQQAARRRCEAHGRRAADGRAAAAQQALSPARCALAAFSSHPEELLQNAALGPNVAVGGGRSSPTRTERLRARCSRRRSSSSRSACSPRRCARCTSCPKNRAHA